MKNYLKEYQNYKPYPSIYLDDVIDRAMLEKGQDSVVQIIHNHFVHKILPTFIVSFINNFRNT